MERLCSLRAYPHCGGAPRNAPGPVIPMIHLQNLSFGYTSTLLFDGITCDLPDKCYCYGANGSGKTTLLQIIAGILQPSSGEITRNHQTHWRTALFLDHSFLFDELTIQAHLDWMRSMYGDIQKTAQLFDIAPYTTRRPADMSAGEKQWCALCLSFCMPCDMILLDEPARSLDDTKCAQLLEILRLFADDHDIIVTGHRADHPFSQILSPVSLSDLR